MFLFGIILFNDYLAFKENVMIISKISTWVAFRANFNDKYDIVHQFTNMDGCPLSRNDHVDYLSSALIEKDNRDIWNAPIILSTSSDEDPPVVMNGCFIGGGHGQPGAVDVYSPNHGKTLADVGAVYQDGEGTKYTLIRVHNEDYLNFISENIGESVYNYRFKSTIVGKLKYISDGKDTSDVKVKEQSLSFLYSANRILKKKIVGYKDGEPKTILFSIECDYGEIQEDYQIINPATVAPALTAGRPEGGYKHTPDMSLIGEPMLTIKYIFRINPDGTILVDFDVERLQNVRFDRFMGVMYQEKKNVYGGGIFRFLSNLKPFTTPEGTFDFSKPYPLRGAPYPESYSPTADDYFDKDKPFDRIVDYFRDTDGNDKLGFACGFLPIYDGKPETRKVQLSSAIHIYKTRKAYPNFMAGITRNSFRGVAYKKFFDTANRSSCYAMEYNDKKYIYFDFFSENELSYPVGKDVSLLELSGDLTYSIDDGEIKAKATCGHALFIEN